MEASQDSYPATLDIDFPQSVNKLTTAFRIFTVIPIAIIAGMLGGILTPAVALMVLFRQKYPRWWFDWNLNLTRFNTRIGAYMLLLMHDYPSTDDDQAVHLALRYPDAETELVRWKPLVKWFLAIPHFIVLMFMGIAVMVLSVIAWFAILFTGKYPESFFDFVVGVMRWTLRVQAYASILITDQYPPFSLT
jgi:hypothetical protein